MLFCDGLGNRHISLKTRRFWPGSLLALLFLVVSTLAQNSTNVWQGVEQLPQGKSASEIWVQPQVFRAFSLNHGALRSLLARAPTEAAQAAAFSQTSISLPMPDGTVAQFRFVEAPVMAPELAAQFPEIKTYLGQGIDDPAATVRFDLNSAGFHAQILAPSGAVYVDPYLRGDTNLYICYFKRDYRRSADGFQCLLAGKDSGAAGSQLLAQGQNAAVSGSNLRTYRLAVAATGEYTTYFGGTVSAGLAAIVT